MLALVVMIWHLPDMLQGSYSHFHLLQNGTLACVQISLHGCNCRAAHAQGQMNSALYKAAHQWHCRTMLQQN